MAIKSEFDVPFDCMKFTTRTNGDRIEMRKLHLGPEQAAHLATLINTPNGILRVQIKAKVIE